MESKSPGQRPQHIIMVKKRLLDGEPCKKCVQAEDLLVRRGLWDQIDEVIWAQEGDETSRGMVLSKEHEVQVAPFFLVEQEGNVEVYLSVMKVVKDVLTKGPSGKVARERAREAEASGASPLVGEKDLTEIASTMEAMSPEELVHFALKKLGSRCAIAFSGAEDVALIDMASKSGCDYSVFCLDTGRLHPETYRFIDCVREFYGIEIRLISPQSEPLEQLVRKKGLFSFYEDGHGECCGVRKLEPLRRVLAQYDGWVTGQRRDQSPTRADVPALLWDTAHKKVGMLKANPLAAWTQKEVWNYIRENGVPYNELHDRGFVSIGCEPCTRPTRPGEHERAGRWWWEESTRRECGLHSSPTKSTP